MLPNTPATGYKIFALSMITMATSDSIASILVKDGFNSALINVFRFSFLCFVPLIIAICTSKSHEILHAKHKKMIMLRGLFQSCAAIFYYSAFKYIPFSMASSIFFCSPIAILAFSSLILGEKVTLRQWFTVIVGFTGMFLIINPLTIDFSSVDSQDSLIGFALGILAMFSYMFVQIFTKKVVGKDSTLAILFWSNLISIFICSIVSFLFNADLTYITLPNLSLIGALSVLALLAQFLFVLPFKYVRASDLAPLNYMQLATTIVIATAFMGERPPLLAFIGMILIFTAGTLQGIFASKNVQ